MKTLNAVRRSSERIVAVGRDRLRSAKNNRRRDSLLTQLGQLCYEDRSGTIPGDSDADFDRLVAKLLVLDEPRDDSDGMALVPDRHSNWSEDVTEPSS